MNKLLLLLNFLPIVVIFLLVSYTDIFAAISNTILGKLFALLIIFFYIKQDKYIGLFVCLLVISYYQSDYISRFDWLNKPVTHLPSSSTLSPKTIDPIFENMATLSDSGLGLSDAYPISLHKESDSDKKSKFRKTYCKKGHLIHKGQPISNENSEHIFPEIKHADEHHKCNLCDNSCDFSFLNKKIDTEEILVKPKSSNDWVVIVWESMMSYNK
jgi:hypothetical protein